MDEDIAAIKAWAQIFKDPVALAETIGKRWLFHGMAVKADIAKEQVDWHDEHYFDAGDDTAAALVELLGPIESIHYAHAHLDYTHGVDHAYGYGHDSFTHGLDHSYDHDTYTHGLDHAYGYGHDSLTHGLDHDTYTHGLDHDTYTHGLDHSYGYDHDSFSHGLDHSYDHDTDPHGVDHGYGEDRYNTHELEHIYDQKWLH